MTKTEITETIKMLEKFANIPKASHVTTFVGYRKMKDGSRKEVAVTIRDFGENAPASSRYVAAAKWKGGHAASGDGPSIQAALGTIKWAWGGTGDMTA